MIITINGIGCWGEGFHGWEATRLILQGKNQYQRELTKLPAPKSLPDNERRRASQIIRLAVLCAEDACQQADYHAEDLPVIFASSNGDGFIIDRILDSLSTPSGLVSPSFFHNSVHNAPAGYWMIGHHSHQPATSLALNDETLAAALLKAAAEAHSEDHPVLFCIYDAPIPGPLSTVRQTDYSFGCALILHPGKGEGITLSLSLKEGKIKKPMSHILPECLEEIARANPAGRILPLLRAIALGEEVRLSLPYGANHIQIVQINDHS